MRRSLGFEGLNADELDIFTRVPGRTVVLYGLRDALLLDPVQLFVHCLPHELGERPVPPGIDQWLHPLDLRRLGVDHRFSFHGTHDQYTRLGDHYSQLIL